MFHYQVAIWECGCTVWHEFHGSQNVHSFPSKMKMTPGGFDRLLRQGQHFIMDVVSLKVWINLINLYNARDLTYAEDAPRAFAGLIKAFTKILFPNGFFWGLPSDCFDAALLWIPAEILNRRLPKTAEAEAPPSWSWMGWQGTIMDNVWARREAQRNFRTSWMTTAEALTPECEWCYVEEGNPANPLPLLRGSHALRPKSILMTHAEIATFYIKDHPAGLDDITNGYPFKTRILANADGLFSGVLMGQTELDQYEEGLEVECLSISSSTNEILGGGSWEGLF